MGSLAWLWSMHTALHSSVVSFAAAEHLEVLLVTVDWILEEMNSDSLSGPHAFLGAPLLSTMLASIFS